MEHTWKILISCIEKWVKYTGGNVTENHGRPYILSYYSKINLLAKSMENCLGLCYKKLLIYYHRNTHTDNALSRSYVNLAFKRLQPKITKNQKIQQLTKNEGN